MNNNCLIGMACPECKSEGPLEISITGTARVHDDGTDDVRNHEWDDQSDCSCVECGHFGTVATFTIEKQPKETVATFTIK